MRHVKAKRAFIMGKISNASDNPRRYWHELNSVFNPKHTNQNESITVVDGGTEVDPSKTSDFMNAYFASVGAKLANKITSDHSLYLNLISAKPCKSLLIS